MTALDQADAERLIAEALGRSLPPIAAVIKDIDVSTLDEGHVLPNMLPPVDRGIWFPAGAGRP